MRSKKVLLVDDHAGFTRLLRLTLERCGACTVREENISSRAAAAAIDFGPDIVFCDVDMPGADGGEVARQIRAHPSLSDTPIVFLTTLLEAEEGRAEIGQFPFLPKPVSVAAVLQCIHQLTPPTRGTPR